MNGLLHKFTSIIYDLIGPEASSNLANSYLGRIIIKIVFGNPNKLKVFDTNEKIKLLLTPNEASMFGVAYLGSMNILETKLLKKYLKYEGIFIDIGAYIDGWHSLVASRIVGSSGKVFTFEPYKKYCGRLKRNITLNNFSNITVEQIAISDKNAIQDFYPSENISSLYGNHIKINKAVSKINKIRVKTMTLDSYCQIKKLSHVDFIKIDVECAEMDVLRGATKTLSQKNAPDFLIEIIDKYLKTAGSSEKEILDFMSKYNYEAFEIVSEGLLHYKKTSSRRSSLNLFFTKKIKNHEDLIKW